MLARAAKAVAAIFSGFGGFLLKVQPPEGVLNGFTIGLATTVSALVFLFLSVLVQGRIGNKYRLVLLVLTLVLAAAGVFSGLQYQSAFGMLTLDLPAQSGSEKIVVGDQLTQRAAARKAQTGESLSNLLLDFGGKSHREDVWTRESINNAKVLLSNGYLKMSVFISASVFCFAELLFPSAGRKREDPQSRK
jgi:general stress protein CsbA